MKKLYILAIFSFFTMILHAQENDKLKSQIQAVQEDLDRQIAPYLQKFHDEMILVTIDGDIVYFRDLKQGFINTLKNHVSLIKDKPLDENIVRNYLRQLAQRQTMKIIVLKEAKKLKVIIPENSVLESLNRIKDQNKDKYGDFLKYNLLTEESLKQSIHDQLMAEELFKIYEKDIPALTEQELHESYEKNRPLFKVPRKIRFSAINIKNADKAPETIEKNRKMVLDIYQKLQKGQSFENLAKNFSDDKITRKNGGDQGYKIASEIEDLYKPLLSMKINEIKMVSFDDGFYIAKLTEDIPEKDIPFEEIKDRLNESLYAYRKQDVQNKKIQELLKIYKPEFSKNL